MVKNWWPNAVRMHYTIPRADRVCAVQYATVVEWKFVEEK